MARKPKPLIIGVGLIKRNDKVVISFSSADIGRLINDTGIQLAAGLDVDKAAECLTGAIWSFIFSWRLETSSAPGYVIERVRKIERGARALRVELDGRFTGYWGKQLTKSVWPSTFCCGARSQHYAAAGTRQRRFANAARNIPDVATVSDRALIGLRAFFRSFVKYGTRPHLRASRWRSPSGCNRTTGASFVDAMFQVGSTFGSGFTVLNSRARASAGRKLAYRPHMMAMW
jgi:hypothetical protein